MRKVSRVANACQIRSSECGEKTRKRVWSWRLAVLPRRERRGYYGIALASGVTRTTSLATSRGIHAGEIDTKVAESPEGGGTSKRGRLVSPPSGLWTNELQKPGMNAEATVHHRFATVEVAQLQNLRFG